MKPLLLSRKYTLSALLLKFLLKNFPHAKVRKNKMSIYTFRSPITIIIYHPLRLGEPRLSPTPGEGPQDQAWGGEMVLNIRASERRCCDALP